MIGLQFKTIILPSFNLIYCHKFWKMIKMINVLVKMSYTMKCLPTLLVYNLISS